MRPSLALAALAAAGVACAAGGSAGAEPQEAGIAAAGSFRARPLVRGLASPVHLAAPKSEPRRLYVVEQAGRIRVVERGRLLGAAFLDIRDRVGSGGERGLLSVAFHPDYARNRRFYVNYTDTAGNTNVVEFRSNGRRALAGSARRLLFVRQPYANHNGGQLAFGPDGRLYVGMGDGGSGGDPEDRAQNMRSLLGKLLSINVATKGVRIEALGLRNPWRFSFDRANGDLYIGDVGQGEIEEIDYTPRAQFGALQNYGWDLYEGRSRFEETPQGPGTLVGPIAQYTHADGCSVTGGFPYRGSNAALRGRYIYGDYCSGIVWSLAVVGGEARSLRREDFTIENLSSFGEDAAGELYGVSQSGTIYRLTP